MMNLAKMAGIADALRDAWPQVANHLWQTTVFVLAAAVLALLLKKNQARARCWVWMAASAKFMVAFALLTGVGSYFAKPKLVSAPANQAVYFAVEDFSEPFIAPAVIEPPFVAPKPHLNREQELALACAAVWIVGFVTVLVTWCVSWRRVARAVRAAEPMHDGRVVDALRRIEREARVKRPVALRVSDGAMEPGVFGVWRPVLLWPAGISARLDDAHLEAVLAHEVCHVRRRDNLTAALHMLVEAAFWFHPLVWWVGARLVAERERACDEEVLRVCGRPQAYAEGILKVCAFCVESPLECVAGVTGADLKQRVLQIMTARVSLRLGWSKKLLLGAAALAAIAAPIVVGLNSPLRVLAADEGWEKAAGGAQQFDVASVRENKSGGESDANFTLDGNGNAYFVVGKDDKTAPAGNLFRATNQTLLRYIIFAYKLTGTQELALRMQFWAGLRMDVPAWVAGTRYDIEARAPGAASKDQMRLMMQSLLAQRFKLAVHKETRQAPVFAMVLEKPGVLGPQLRAHPASDTCATTAIPDRAGAGVDPGGTTTTIIARTAVSDSQVLPIPCGMIARLPASMPGRHRIGGRNVTLAMLAESMPAQTGLATFPRPVVDGTGLSGTFDFTLEWAPPAPVGEGDMAPGPKAQGDVPGPSVALAMKEQLGIKLESTKGPVELLVIDHVERPTAQDADAGTDAAAAVAVASAKPVEQTPVPAAVSAKPVAQALKPVASATPTFAVASIRLSPPDARSMSPPNGTAENFSARMASVESMIGFAYDIPTVIGMSVDPAHFFLPHAANLLGGPGWVTTDRYDLTAKLDEPELDAWRKLPEKKQQAQLRLMMQALLADRFHLTMRRETREMPVYALVVAKDGPKFKPASGTPADVNDSDDPAKPYDDSKPYQNRWRSGAGMIEGRDVTMDDLPEMLRMQRELDSRTVLDQTGLKGRYNIKLKWGSVDDPKEQDGPSLFTAIQEQLGLKLEPQKVPMEVLVIDHIEKPTPN